MPAGDLRGPDVGPKSLILPYLYPLLWVLEMEGAVASDMSAYHRIDDQSAIGTRRWSLLVPQLHAYSGAVRMRLQVLARQDQAEQEQLQSGADGGGGGVVAKAADGTPLLAGPPSPMQGGKTVEATPVALAFSDIGDMFSFNSV